MNSLIIGIARTGTAYNYVLNTDTKYISMCGSKPEVSFSIDCGQDQFIKVINGLRYDDADPGSSAEAISFFQNLTTKLFSDLKYLQIDENDISPLHIRLVTTPFELAQIPFEFVLCDPFIADTPRTPLLAHPNREITLTREVRQESDARYIWPNKPRILFAWAQPVPGMTVPYKEHLAVLESIVIPLAKPDSKAAKLQPDIIGLLTELPDASVESIKKEIQAGINQKMPYTHIHILAHGGYKLIYGVMEFQLILCKDGMKDSSQKIDGKTLAEAIVPADHNHIPTVVSLSVCDSGYLGNTILPSGSLIYQLHNNGIPCVFASQFPLTQQGSVKLTERLYYELINACDPRIALYKTRIALKAEQGHDWASLVAYARFPEDINQQLQDAQLKMAFRLMKTTNLCVDHVLKHKEQMASNESEAAFNDLQLRLDKSINQLSDFLCESKTESTLLTRELRAEHLGLLGSACKRKAEYLFRRIEFEPGNKMALTLQSMDSLKSAMYFYKSGFDANADSHWNAMQYLSIKAALEGSLKNDTSIWTIIEFMADRDVKRINDKEEKSLDDTQKQLWAWGTLAELYLVKPFTVQDNLFDAELNSSREKAKGYMEKLRISGDEEIIDSTARQFDRYISWWPVLYPDTFRKELKEMAIELRNLLLKK
jgi:hypothetical protein